VLSLRDGEELLEAEIAEPAMEALQEPGPQAALDLEPELALGQRRAVRLPDP
jgi:hypothetical protein